MLISRLRDDLTEDQLIDAFAQNRVYMSALGGD